MIQSGAAWSYVFVFNSRLPPILFAQKLCSSTSEGFIPGMKIRSWRTLVAALLTAAVTPTLANAQSWPTRPVTMVVPFPAGGATDLLARALGLELSDKLGQQFVIDNRTGATGNIGAAAVAKATPDGYTILFATPGPIALNQLMSKSLSFDPQTDFTPIILIAKSPHIYIAKKSLAAKDLPELLNFAKANPGKLTAGIPGNGTTAHISLELLLQITGAKVTVVPYRGGVPMTADIMGGQIDIGADLISSQVAQVSSGNVRALAVTSSKRSEQLPNVPTVQESGFPGFEATAWFVLAVPTGTPVEIVRRVNSIVNSYLQSEQGKQQLAKLDLQASGGAPEDAKAFITNEVAKWGPVIKAANITASP
jgi:tripartite-type tricarboxylate transporter receptor subunit TctC